MPTSPMPARTQGLSLLRLTATGLLAAIISAILAAITMQALADYLFYAKPSSGTPPGAAFQTYAEALPTALMAAFLWYMPIGTFVFPPLAKISGAAAGSGGARLAKLIVLGAIIWLLAGEAIYLMLSPDALTPSGVKRNDLITALLSGVLFAVIYDLLLRRRDYLLARRRL